VLSLRARNVIIRNCSTNYSNSGLPVVSYSSAAEEQLAEANEYVMPSVSVQRPPHKVHSNTPQDVIRQNNTPSSPSSTFQTTAAPK